MTATLDSHQTKPVWAKAIAKAAKEFAMTPLPILAGKVPDGLRGTLYRNGPARLERGGEPVGHWFDGDGAILAVHFTDSAPQGTYRYVKTAGYLAESEAGEFLFSNYGMAPSEPVWQYWLRLVTNNLPIKNAANTSVIALPDRLLALWEGGKPYALDLETIATKGLDDLGGLVGDQPYSAHPQRDPQTGDIFNFGISMGASPNLNIYRSDRTGKITRKAAIKLDGVPVLHSVVMAGQYLVFVIPPVRLKMLPIMMGTQSFCDALEWQPQKPTQLLVVDRDTLEVVSRGEADPWFHWHFGNGCTLADGTILLDLVRYRDFPQTNEFLREVATGQTHTPSYGSLWQFQLDPRTGQIKESTEAIAESCEFPVVQPHQVGQPWRYTYLNVHRPGVNSKLDMFGAIARFDYETGTLTKADCGENCYPMEPIYAPDAIHPDRGWVLTVVFDGNRDRSEVWIFDSDRLDDEPVCRLGLPSIIPLGFHGTWRSKN